MSEVTMVEKQIDKPTLAIVCFGPALPTTGFKAADYYQVTIDPDMCSPTGNYIRFGFYDGDEITGWQRTQAMTIVEILGVSHKKLNAPDGYSPNGDSIGMMVVE